MSKQVNRIIVVDNNSTNEGAKIIDSIENQDKVDIIRNNTNLGIATALNQGVKEAMKFNFDFVLTFDQDSTPFDNIINVIQEVYNSFSSKNEIGAIGVSYTSSFEDTFNAVPKQREYLEKDYLITSGCLICVKSFVKIGGFRDDFFIDNVDIEYSLRLKKNGKKSLMSIKPGMIHKAGDPLKRKILGISVSSSNHNSFRRYFMSRNHVIVTRDYFFTDTYFVLKLNFFYILSIFKIILVEKEVILKLKKSYKGFKDGFKGTLKYSFPEK
ncbi:glycosyltransferase [Flavobacterium luteolum]|uniref:glycosyltransferase n=1 Tax=Flavobacterium luteolum TaxID=3003259 RepID=UPI00248D844F|nr:glycosyltransferase [Flavobacterium luteolum]